MKKLLFAILFSFPCFGQINGGNGLSGSGTITTAAGSSVIIPFSGMGCAIVDVQGSFTGSFAVQGSAGAGSLLQPRDTLQQLVGKWVESIGSAGHYYIGGFASQQIKLAGPVSSGSASIVWTTTPGMCDVYTFAIPGSEAGNGFFGGTVSATTTQTTVADSIQGHDLADVGVVWSGITGNPSGCVIQAQYFFGQAGPAINTGPPLPVTPGTNQVLVFVGPFGLATQFVYSCNTYPGAGTITLQITYKPGGKTLINGIQPEINASWTSATGNNTALQQNVSGYGNTMVFVSQGSTITGGQINFEISDTTAFANAYPVQCQRDDGVAATNYVLQATTNHAWSCAVNGAQAFRVRLSPQITGTGTVTVGITSVTAASESTVAVTNNPVVFLGGTSPVNLTQINGNTSDTDPCSSGGIATTSAFVNITTATTTAIVPVSASTVVYVCAIAMSSVSTTTANTVIFEQGTGAACAGSPTSLTHTFNNGVANADSVVWGGGNRTLFKTAAANGLCAVTTVGSTPTIGITVTYIQK